MVAREVPERVRQVRVAVAVVERVTGLVEERLVVVQAALRAGDQVDDLRRVGGDHAGPRRLLRPVVEVELDVRLLRRGRSRASGACRGRPRSRAPSCRSPRAARAGAARRRGTRSAPPVVARPSSLSNQRSRELAVDARSPPCSPRRARSESSRSEMPFSSSLRATGSGSSESSASSSSRARSSSSRSSLNAAEASPCSAAELLALRVVGHDGELRLGGAERQLLAAGRSPARRGSRSRARPRARLSSMSAIRPALAGLAQPVERARARRPKARSRPRCSASSCSRVKSSRVARDDLRALRDLLLPDADRAAFLCALEEVALELGFVLGRGSNGGDAHLRMGNVPDDRRIKKRRAAGPFR